MLGTNKWKMSINFCSWTQKWVLLRLLLPGGDDNLFLKAQVEKPSCSCENTFRGQPSHPRMLSPLTGKMDVLLLASELGWEVNACTSSLRDTGEVFISWITGGLQASPCGTSLYGFLNMEQWHPRGAAEGLGSASPEKGTPPPTPGEGYNTSQTVHLLALGRARFLLESWTTVIRAFAQCP